ncbi:response regulator transcription factor [Larkinella insperata]|uniref:Response regulator transcription factor n=1 Tax=Larkinella insperata TaxID=332158 RepID=A0ABW3Q6E7_9BACT|nr:LytTR family transcriptional regulator DNA-binding domain-containing protein [Larkinella insperata]
MIEEAIQYPALIKYLKGFSNYTWLYYCDGRKVLLSKSLCYFEKKLPSFFRVHKTALVNPHYITDFKAPPGHKMSGSVLLKDDLTLPVSRRRWNQLVDSLQTMMVQTKSADGLLPEQPYGNGEAAGRPVASRRMRQVWVVMADEMKGNLVRQIISEKWPLWRLQVFETVTKLQSALQEEGESEMPAMIILDGNQDKSVRALQAIKRNVRFRFIPTLLLVSAGNSDVAEQSYASGANSVIVLSADLTRFIQAVEKTFRYWLSTATAPYATARLSTALG